MRDTKGRVGGSQKTTGFIYDKSGKKIGINGTQDHHIISDKNPRTVNHPLWEKAGMTPNDPANKIRLPTVEGAAASTTRRSIHQGRHTDAVSEYFEQKMTRIKNMGEGAGWQKPQYATKLRELLSQEGQALKQGQYALNKNARDWSVPYPKQGE